MSKDEDGESTCGMEAFGGCCGKAIYRDWCERVVNNYGSLDNFVTMSQYWTPHPQVTFFKATYKHKTRKDADQERVLLAQKLHLPPTYKRNDGRCHANKRANNRANKHHRR